MFQHLTRSHRSIVQQHNTYCHHLNWSTVVASVSITKLQCGSPNTPMFAASKLLCPLVCRRLHCIHRAENHTAAVHQSSISVTNNKVRVQSCKCSLLPGLSSHPCLCCSAASCHCCCLTAPLGCCSPPACRCCSPAAMLLLPLLAPLNSHLSIRCCGGCMP